MSTVTNEFDDSTKELNQMRNYVPVALQKKNNHGLTTFFTHEP